MRYIQDCASRTDSEKHTKYASASMKFHVADLRKKQVRVNRAKLLTIDTLGHLEWATSAFKAEAGPDCSATEEGIAVFAWLRVGSSGCCCCYIVAHTLSEQSLTRNPLGVFLYARLA